MALNIKRASQLSDGPMGRGPGPIYRPRYDLDSTIPKDSRVIFSTAPRFEKASAVQGPGPGAYALPPQRGPAFSLRFREKFGTAGMDSRRENPAPGHVTRLETGMTRKKNAPAFSLRSRRVLTETSDFTPAPGHSQHIGAASERQVLSTKPNLSSIKFSTSNRPKGKDNSATGDIGPGEYDVRKGEFLIEGNRKPPAYTLQGRWKDRAAERVQPDFHSSTAWTATLPLSTQRSAPMFSMSSRTKFGDPYA